MVFLRGSRTLPRAPRWLQQRGAVIFGITRTVKIFYWADVFAEKEKDLFGPP